METWFRGFKNQALPGGLDSPDAWKFAALIDPVAEGLTPQARRKAMQTICLEVWRAYDLAFRRLRDEAPPYLFEQRFIVDLEQNTPFTLQFWQTNTAQLCYRCTQPTADVYGGGPRAGWGGGRNLDAPPPRTRA